MIEVLVSVLILSFGLLGLAGLQTMAIKNNLSALQRSEAAMLSYLLLDAMRANRQAAVTGAYDLGNPMATDDKVCQAPGGSGLAAADLTAWFNALKSTLGEAETTCAAVDCDAGGSCAVRVFWDDSRAIGGSNIQSIAVRSTL